MYRCYSAPANYCVVHLVIFSFGNIRYILLISQGKELFQVITAETDVFRHVIYDPRPPNLLDHSGLDGCVGSGNYSNIEVKVDVHKTVAFPIRAIVVELGNPPILLFDDLEARSIRLKSAIACMELTLF